MVGGAPRCGLLKSLACGLILAVTSIGAYATQLTINASGQPNYELPIAVPPGIGGMTPKLSLYYDTGTPRGPFGLGWGLRGLSLISRCPGSKLIDGVNQSVKYGANDKLCLDGKRLVQTDAAGAVVNAAVVTPGPANPFQQSDSTGGTTREFRTETDSHTRIRSYGSANDDPAAGPATFKVWTKDGTVYEYKAMLLTGAGRTIAVMWVVSRVTDTVGNYMEFRYVERDVPWGSNTNYVSLGDLGREWNIDQILYTGNGSQLPTSRIVFEYSDLPDTPGLKQERSENFRAGVKVVVTRKLDKVQSYINWPSDQVAKPAAAIKVSTVKLHYNKGVLTGRTVLAAVTACVGAAEDKCVAPTYLSYESGGASIEYPKPTFAPSPNLGTRLDDVMHSKDNKIGVMVADFNADGRDDILRWSDNPAQNHLLLSEKAKPFISKASNFNILDQNLFKSDNCYRTLITDLNGDGLPDLLRFGAITNTAGASCGSNVATYIYRNKGDGSFDRLTYNGPALERVQSTYHYDYQRPTQRTRGANFFLIDFDRDGKHDIITTERPAFDPVTAKTDPCSPMICTRVYRGNGDGSFTEVSTNIANKTLYVTPYNISTAGSAKNIADVNGDGLPDLVHIEQGNFNQVTTYTSRGDGNFDAAPSWPFCSNLLDFNGDGLADCLVADIDVTKNRLLLNDGTGQLLSVTKFNLTHAGAELYGVGLGFMIMDLDKDGRDDIFRWNDDSNSAVFYSNGDGTFKSSMPPNSYLMRSDNGVRSVTGDFTGNGNIEFLNMLDPSVVGKNQIYAWKSGGPADRLKGIRGDVHISDIKWSNLDSLEPGAPSHLSDRGTVNAAVYPNVDLAGPMFLVTSAYSGSNHTAVDDNYAYYGYKASLKDRSVLGFREIVRTDKLSSPPVIFMSQFIQNGANTGSVSVAEARIESSTALTIRGQLLSRTTNVYCDMTAAAGAQAVATYLAPCPTTAKVRQPYLYTSKAEAWDLAGASLPVVTQTNTYNRNGGITESLRKTEGTALGINQSFTGSVVNTYHPDNISNDNWLLGKLKLTTVKKSAPNSIGSITTSAGTAPQALATSGSGAVTAPPPTAPGNLNWLIPVLNMILED